jgi:hypothetical protein
VVAATIRQWPPAVLARSLPVDWTFFPRGGVQSYLYVRANFPYFSQKHRGNPVSQSRPPTTPAFANRHIRNFEPHPLGKMSNPAVSWLSAAGNYNGSQPLRLFISFLNGLQLYGPFGLRPAD